MSRSLGVDVHSASIYVITIDPSTCAPESHEMPVEEQALQAFERQLRPDDRIALEATTNAYYFYDRWSPLVAEVVIANTVKLRPWLGDEDKSDRNDAFWLALLNMFGCLPCIWMPDPETRQDREVAAHYSALVRERTRCKNAIRALLRKHGLTNPATDLQSVDARDLVIRQHARLSEVSKRILNSLFAQLDSIEARLDSIQPLVVQRAVKRAETPLLLTVPGLELTLILMMMAAVGTIDRFPTPGSLVKYAGLIPKEKSSAGKIHRGGSQRTGSRSLRWAITEATQSLVKQPGRFRNLYRKLARKGHAVAMTACARKLLTVIWHLLKTGEPYREVRPASRQRKQARVKRKVTKARNVLSERRVVLEDLLKHAPQLKELAGARHGFPLSMRPAIAGRAAPSTLALATQKSGFEAFTASSRQS